MVTYLTELSKRLRGNNDRAQNIPLVAPLTMGNVKFYKVGNRQLEHIYIYDFYKIFC